MSISNNNLNSNNLYKIRIEHFAVKKFILINKLLFLLKIHFYLNRIKNSESLF